MNTLCLENYGVSEMETREMKEANGGFLQYAIAAATAVAWVFNKGEELGKALA